MMEDVEQLDMARWGEKLSKDFQKATINMGKIMQHLEEDII